MPKTSPAAKELNVYTEGFMFRSVVAQLPITCRVTNTVANPAAMKNSVATIERGERRESPHTP